MQRQRVPSLIFCVGSSASLTSAVSYQTLDTEDLKPSSFRGLDSKQSSLRGLGRGFGLVGTDDALISKAPRLPKRNSSRGMGFRKLSTSFGMDRKDSMKNATFQLGNAGKRTGGKQNKNSLVDRFGCLAPMLSPTLTQKSHKTRSSEMASDTPLAVPRRKPSELSCLSPLSPNSGPKSMKAYSMLSGLQNAKFDDLLNSSSHSSRNSSRRPTTRPVQARLFNTNHVRM
mmetsp:Transcript_20516/g.50333  ORF Transcript_20516/g.50333 Transcript_20516/m.50333 type:complete len:228 (-) Transcript_20516:76-759(-)